MLVFALLFMGLAALGACIGFGTIGQPVYGQALNSYGWALCINGVALAVYFVFTRMQRSQQAWRIGRALSLQLQVEPPGTAQVEKPPT